MIFSNSSYAKNADFDKCAEYAEFELTDTVSVCFPPVDVQENMLSSLIHAVMWAL